MRRLQIVTCNNTYDNNGKYLESFHEIHEIDNLRNIYHIIVTITNVVNTNLLFMDENTKLDSVILCGSDMGILLKIVNHFKENPIGNINIIEAETAYSMMN